MSEIIVEALSELREDELLEAVRTEHDKGVPALDIVGQLQKGMRVIGDRFERQEYFLSEMIMASEIFKEAVAILGEEFAAAGDAKYGTFVIGTIFGDIHDIGKDIVASTLSCNGFKVVDLGVEVPAEKWIAAIKEQKPRVIGISSLLTTAFDNIKKAIKEIDEAGLRSKVKILVGGGPMTQEVCDYVGADGYGKDVQAAIGLAQSMAGGE